MTCFCWQLLHVLVWSMTVISFMFPATDANLDRNMKVKRSCYWNKHRHMEVSLFSCKTNLLTAALAWYIFNRVKACFAEKTLSGAAEKWTVNLDNTCKYETVLVISGMLWSIWNRKRVTCIIWCLIQNRNKNVCVSFKIFFYF